MENAGRLSRAHGVGARPVRVFVAEADPAARSALVTLLGDLLGADVVGQAERPAELVQALAGANPDVVLMEWGLGGASASDLLRAARAISPSARFVATGARPETRRQALAAGADGFACKGDGAQALIDALSGRLYPDAR